MPAHRAAFAALLCCLVLSGGPEAIGAEDSREAPGWRFGYSSQLLFDLSREDASTALTLWTRELAKEAGGSEAAKALIYDDLESLAAAIRDEKVDFIALTATDFMKIREPLALEPALFGTKNGKESAPGGN